MSIGNVEAVKSLFGWVRSNPKSRVQFELGPSCEKSPEVMQKRPSTCWPKGIWKNYSPGATMATELFRQGVSVLFLQQTIASKALVAILTSSCFEQTLPI
ncbi:MAG TPA: hypothetical protein VND64_14280 [Pirellulales bacterium]|nr:hypothetical protein [Pirellulales bacterium]